MKPHLQRKGGRDVTFPARAGVERLTSPLWRVETALHSPRERGLKAVKRGLWDKVKLSYIPRASGG